MQEDRNHTVLGPGEACEKVHGVLFTDIGEDDVVYLHPAFLAQALLCVNS